MLFPIRNDKFDSFWRTGNIKFKLYQGYINVKYVSPAYLGIEILWKKIHGRQNC